MRGCRLVIFSPKLNFTLKGKVARDGSSLYGLQNQTLFTFCLQKVSDLISQQYAIFQKSEKHERTQKVLI